MWYWLMLVVSVVLGSLGVIKLGVPILSAAGLATWLILILGWYMLFCVLYIVLIQWWLKYFFPSMEVKEVKDE